MGHCSHLSIEEREDVMLLGRQHKGVREIARAIGRDKSTVSGELARNSSATDAAPYHRASTARRKCERRRGRCRRQSLMGDPVLGRTGGACLVTLVDRATGYLAGGPAPRKGKDEVADVAERSLADVPTQTLTLDRGKESAQARQTQERLGVPVYLCAPHHPWQRGTNENTDGLLRDFLPKGGGLDGATDAEVNAAYAMLNRRPRKRLKWKCPWEVYHRQSLHLL